MIQVKAYAKINLCLEVLGPRPDGYHDIVTILQTIDWADDVRVEMAEDLSLSCDDPALEQQENLVLQAARLLRARAGQRRGAHISLNKRIPAGAGLGGGSSDAAETLKALNALWRLNLPLAELGDLAVEVGSDVSFFLHGGAALAQGRGERLTPLPAPPHAWVVLLVPPLQVPEKTRRLFSLLRPDHFSTGGTARRWVRALEEERGQMPPLVNTFERVADQAFPGLEEYRRTLADAGAEEVCLTGAGPALFSLFPEEKEARGVAERVLKGKGAEIRVCKIIDAPWKR